MDTQTLAQMIDHTLLRADATDSELTALCQEAVTYGLKSVCVNSGNISIVTPKLKGSQVLPICVVGFPLGASSSAAKAYEAKMAIEAGAQEIDMVMNIGAFKSARFDDVKSDIKSVVLASSPFPVKVIVEVGFLSHDEIAKACKLAEEAGAAFVKSCTGFGPGKASPEIIALMRKSVSPPIGVKASGGIKNHADALALIAAGATRIGTSNALAILAHQDSANTY